MKAGLSIVVAVLLLTGCAGSMVSNPAPPPSPVEPSQSTQPSPGTDAEQPSASSAKLEMPPEWNKDEKDIFRGFVLFYPEIARINFTGKRALMENSYLICQAYGEGFLRREIQAAISGESFSAEMADDWMALSVTYLCPEYLAIQMAN